jgi:hypothetical protein
MHSEAQNEYRALTTAALRAGATGATAVRRVASDVARAQAKARGGARGVYRHAPGTRSSSD